MQKVFGSGKTTLIISKEEIMKITKSLKYANLLIKGVCETIESEAKKQKMDFSIYYYIHQVLVY